MERLFLVLGFLLLLLAACTGQSPGLGKLAYVQLGDIWVKTLPDGEPVRLTTNGDTCCPTWSPSGEWLAYGAEDVGTVITRPGWNVSYTVKYSSSAANIVWSPTNDEYAYHVHFTEIGDFLLTAHPADPDPLVLEPIVRPQRHQVSDFAWSPDGKWLAYRLIRLGKDKLEYAGLWRVRPDGSSPIEVIRARDPQSSAPNLDGWSPSARDIIFWPSESRMSLMYSDVVTNPWPILNVPIYLVSRNGGTATTLIEHIAWFPARSRNLPTFSVPTPKGDRLAVVTGSGYWDWTSRGLAVVSSSTRNKVQLTPQGIAVVHPSWSPDSRYIAFSAMPDQHALRTTPWDDKTRRAIHDALMGRRIWVVNSFGPPKPHPITDDPMYRDEHPTWSVDGRQILFGRMARASDKGEGVDSFAPASLWLVERDGNNPRIVVEELSFGWREGGIPWYSDRTAQDWKEFYDWWPGPAR